MLLADLSFHISRKTKENRHVFDFEPFPMSEIGVVLESDSTIVRYLDLSFNS
jgi:hypothetical protein